MDHYGYHALDCPYKLFGRIRRHNLVADALYALAKEGGFHPKREAREGWCPQESRSGKLKCKKPADILIDGDNHRQTCVDVVVASPLSAGRNKNKGAVLSGETIASLLSPSLTTLSPTASQSSAPGLEDVANEEVHVSSASPGEAGSPAPLLSPSPPSLASVAPVPIGGRRRAGGTKKSRKPKRSGGARQPRNKPKQVPLGKALADAANNKIKSHREACAQNGLDFCPFAVDVCGFIEESAADLLKRMASRIAEHSGRSFKSTWNQCVRRMSVAIQLSVARQLVPLWRVPHAGDASWSDYVN